MDIKVLIQSLFDSQGTEKARDELGRFVGSGERAAGSFGKLFDGLTGGFAKIGLAIDGVTRMVGLAGAAVETALGPSAEMDDLVVQFGVLLGSTEAAQQRMEELADFADSTPFDLPGVARASTVLQTLTRGALATGAGLRMVGDVAAGTGQPFDELAMWIGRLYDGLDSGRPVGEALARLQELGVVSGATRGQIEKLQAEGRRGPEVWAVAAGAFDRFGGMMEAKSRTLRGLLSTLGDGWAGLMRAVFGDTAEGAKGPLQFLIDTLDRLREPLAEIMQDARLFWASLYGDDARGFADFLRENAVPGLVALAGTLSDVAKIAVGLWEGALGTGRLAMAGLFQLFQGIYALVMGIPMALGWALERVIGLARKAVQALPEALRPEGASRWLATKEVALSRENAEMWAPGAALGRASQVFADQSAESFGAAGRAFGAVGETRTTATPRKAVAGAATETDQEQGGVSKASQAAARQAAEQARQARDLRIASIEDEDARARSVLRARYMDELAEAKGNLELQTALREKYLRDTETLDADAARRREDFDRRAQETRDQWESQRASLQAQRAEETERMRVAAEERALSRSRERMQALAAAWSGVANRMMGVVGAVFAPIQDVFARMDARNRAMGNSWVATFQRVGLAFAKMIADMATEVLKRAAVWAILRGIAAMVGGPASSAITATTGKGGSGLGSFLMGSFAVGSPYIPRDGLALLHEGEVVAPTAESAAARRGDFGPLARFLGVESRSALTSPTVSSAGDSGPAPLKGRLVDIDAEVLGVLARRGAALVRLQDSHGEAWAG